MNTFLAKTGLVCALAALPGHVIMVRTTERFWHQFEGDPQNAPTHDENGHPCEYNCGEGNFYPALSPDFPTPEPAQADVELEKKSKRNKEDEA